VATLLQALLLSGISMVLAGSSAPASGAEHLFSHMLDMRRHVAGEPTGLHGAQVGVGTLITAALYEALLAYPVAERVDPEAVAAAHPSWAAEEARIRRVHGALAEGILPHARKKWRPAAERRALVADVRGRWEELRAELSAIVRPLAVLRGALEAAGAPVTAGALRVSRDEIRELFMTARDMRARYTVLDLAWDLGLLDTLREPVLAASGVLR
jgi:glycerol-1-phosphate dehydrogenase [NAD(P)+]